VALFNFHALLLISNKLSGFFVSTSHILSALTLGHNYLEPSENWVHACFSGREENPDS